MSDAAEQRRATYAAEKAALQALLEQTMDARERDLAALDVQQPALAAMLRRRLAFALQPAPTEATTTTAEAAPQIARYRIEREIGRGGMGRVWLARRSDGADGQQLAIKQIRSDALDAGALRRFEAERRALARLDHPNIVPLLDTGTDSAGQPYLVTPFVEGEPIQQFVHHHVPGLAARVQLLRQVAAALAHAHQQLIVHRDLKPANVLVEAAASGQPARVRLLDFGIAKLLDAPTDATAAGASLMTLRYAAPEQLSGGPLGVGCDLYALGVLAYELISGKSPYPPSHDPAALVQAIATHTPEALARTGPQPDGERVPADLSAIVLKLLRKRPEDRYRSADALIDELDRWSAGLPVQVMRGQRRYATRIWLRRRWPLLAAGIVLLLLLGLHLLRMDEQLQVAERERRKAAEVADFMITLFQSARPADTAEGSISALALLELGSKRLLDDRNTRLSPQGRAALLVSTGHAFYQLDQQATAQAMFAKAAQLHAADPDAPAALHAEALRFLAMALYAAGDAAAALQKIDQARAVLRAADDRDHDELGSVLNARCVYLGSLGESDPSRRCYADLLAFYDSQPALAEAGVAALVNIAAFELTQGAPETAETLLRRAQAALQSGDALVHGNDLPINLKRQLATSLRDQGRYRDAAALYAEVVADTRRYEGETSRSLIAASVGLSSSFTLAGDLALARAPIEEALRLTADAYPPAHKNSLNVRLEYARWLLAGERLTEARDELQQIQSLRTQQQPLDAGGDALARATLAFVQCQLGERATALPALSTTLIELQQPGMASRQRLEQVRQWQVSCAAAG